MRITDYEGGRALSDVSITLTPQEAEELALYLSRMLKSEEVNRAHLSEFINNRLERELTISIEPGTPARLQQEVQRVA
jgi:hypothetical protein